MLTSRIHIWNVFAFKYVSTKMKTLIFKNIFIYLYAQEKKEQEERKVRKILRKVLYLNNNFLKFNYK